MEAWLTWVECGGWASVPSLRPAEGTHTMEAMSLRLMVDEHLANARAATSGRSSHTIVGGRDHALRQTVLALAAGQELADHESPGEATLQVLAGAVRLTTASDAVELTAGQIVAIPRERHGLHAHDDSAVLLTVAQVL